LGYFGRSFIFGLFGASLESAKIKHAKKIMSAKIKNTNIL
jgi:hypothetical protein